MISRRDEEKGGGYYDPPPMSALCFVPFFQEMGVLRAW